MLVSCLLSLVSYLLSLILSLISYLLSLVVYLVIKYLSLANLCCMRVVCLCLLFVWSCVLPVCAFVGWFICVSWSLDWTAHIWQQRPLQVRLGFLTYLFLLVSCLLSLVSCLCHIVCGFFLHHFFVFVLGCYCIGYSWLLLLMFGFVLWLYVLCFVLWICMFVVRLFQLEVSVKCCDACVSFFVWLCTFLCVYINFFFFFCGYTTLHMKLVAGTVMNLESKQG